MPELVRSTCKPQQTRARTHSLGDTFFLGHPITGCIPFILKDVYQIKGMKHTSQDPQDSKPWGKRFSAAGLPVVRFMNLTRVTGELTRKPILKTVKAVKRRLSLTPIVQSNSGNKFLEKRIEMLTMHIGHVKVQRHFSKHKKVTSLL